MKSHLDSLWEYIKKCDLGLLAIALTLSGISLVAVYSASRVLPAGLPPNQPTKLMIVQTLAIGLGIAAYFIIAAFDLEKFSEFWPWFYAANILLQLTLVIWGQEGDTGNKSWLRFAGIGLQPAEVGKLIYICTLSGHINALRNNLNSFKALAQLCAHTGILLAVIYATSSDLGMCIAYVGIFALMLFASGLSMKIFLPLVAAGCASLVPIWKFFLKGYQKTRFLVLFDPSIDPDKAHNGLQSMMAVGGGQLTGQGYLQGTVNQHGRLPEKWTDFIFATICEEWGFIGAIIVLLIFSLFIWKILHDAWRADNRFGYLVCVGVASMLMVQIMINIGMCLGIMPVIGLTLPFLSYGGTSVLTMYTAIGLVCGLQMRKRPDRLR